MIAVAWFLGVYLFILAPKFDVGETVVVHGGIVGMFLLGILSWKGVGNSGAVIRILMACLPVIGFFLFLLVWLFAIGVFSGNVDGWGHHNYFISVPMYVLTGAAIGAYWSRQNGFYWSVTFVVKLLVGVAALNSVIILCEFSIPQVKDYIESILYQDPGSNIDYQVREDRLRGVASGGAANLSLFFGTMMVMAVGLYRVRELCLLSTVLLLTVVGVALLVVGRTGYLAFGLGVVLYIVAVLCQRKGFEIKRLTWIGLCLVILVASAPFFVSEVFSDGIYQYAIAMFYQGLQGIKDEGTVVIIIEFFEFPRHALAFLFGIGDGSGSFDRGVYADPGFMKMFTAVGFPLALVVYALVAWWSFRVARWSGHFALFLAVAIVWFVSEMKEPFILKGYLARSMWLLIGMMLIYSAGRSRSIVNCERMRGSATRD